MGIFHAFVPDQIKGVMFCQISSNAEFDVILRISGGLNVKTKAVSISALEISYRQPEIKTGCELIFTDLECQCKILHRVLTSSGIQKDFLSEVVTNLCPTKHVSQKDDDYHKIVSFDFNKKSDNQRNCMIAGKDFGKLFLSLIFNDDLTKSDNLTEDRVFKFLQDYIRPGTEFLFVSNGRVVDRSIIPDHTNTTASVSLKVKGPNRTIN